MTQQDTAILQLVKTLSEEGLKALLKKYDISKPKKKNNKFEGSNIPRAISIKTL